MVNPSNLRMGTVFATIGCFMGLGFGWIAQKQLERASEIRLLSELISDSIPDLITGGEGERVEFKTTVRWDVNKGNVNKALEAVIAKTVAGFLNARGGNLLIGVSDDGAIQGLERDYATLRHKNRDGFERMLLDIVEHYLGGEFCPYVHALFTEFDGKDVCLLIVELSPRPVYLKRGGKSEFYLRSGNSTRALDVRESMGYAEHRWPG